MLETERQFFERRISHWIQRLGSSVFPEEHPLEAHYLASESPIPLAAAKGARLLPIEEGAA